MVFSSLEFLFLFLPLTLTVYFIIPKKYIAFRNVALLLVSLLFYGWGEPLYVFLMVASILFSYFYGFMVGKHRNVAPKKARGWLVAAVVTNLGVLGFFKYTDFFIGICPNPDHCFLSFFLRRYTSRQLLPQSFLYVRNLFIPGKRILLFNGFQLFHAVTGTFPHLFPGPKRSSLDGIPVLPE